jgi:hypothetical protein
MTGERKKSRLVSKDGICRFGVVASSYLLLFRAGLVENSRSGVFSKANTDRVDIVRRS